MYSASYEPYCCSSDQETTAHCLPDFSGEQRLLVRLHRLRAPSSPVSAAAGSPQSGKCSSPVFSTSACCRLPGASPAPSISGPAPAPAPTPALAPVPAPASEPSPAYVNASTCDRILQTADEAGDYGEAAFVLDRRSTGHC